MKIFLMLSYSRAKADRPVFTEVVENLRGEGFEVTVGIAESFVVDPGKLRVEADLYILKSNSEMWRNIAAVLDSRGARILNPYAACATTVNKIRAFSRLAAAHVPIPRSWVTGDLQMISEVPDAMPLLLKPNIGHGSTGIRVVRDRAEFAEIELFDAMLAQEVITPIEDEIKLYVIGDRVFGIRKLRDERESIPVESVFEEIARRCGNALGLEIYGVDVVVSPQGPLVVDVNYFPSFKGVPNVAGPLTDHIREYARTGPS